MSLFSVPRMLAAGSVVGASTSIRVGAGCASLVAARTPVLLRLGLSSAGGERAASAQSAFRDELLGLARDSAELSWREMRRGVDALDTYTRATHPGPPRPYRVKA